VALIDMVFVLFFCCAPLLALEFLSGESDGQLRKLWVHVICAR
jgi:hypothetical protein